MDLIFKLLLAIALAIAGWQFTAYWLHQLHSGRTQGEPRHRRLPRVEIVVRIGMGISLSLLAAVTGAILIWNSTDVSTSLPTWLIIAALVCVGSISLLTSVAIILTILRRIRLLRTPLDPLSRDY